MRNDIFDKSGRLIIRFRVIYLWIFLLIGFSKTESIFTQNLSNQFLFYSAAKKKEVKIQNIHDWEEQRYRILESLQEVMGPIPDWSSLPPITVRFIDTLEAEKYIRYNIIFLANKDEQVPALLYIPKKNGISGKLPGILALHPTGKLGKLIIDGQGLKNREYGRELAERGYIVIAPDYPGFGGLSHYNFENDPYASGTMAAIFYNMRCIDLLLDFTDVDPDRIGVIGHSLGGHNAMFTAAFDERLKVTVSSCGWTQLNYYERGEAVNKRYGGRLGPFAQEVYMPLFRDKYQLVGENIPFDFHEIIALIAPRGFFSNSPINDSNFQVKGVLRGYELSKEVYEAMGVCNNLHIEYPEAEHDFPYEIRQNAYEFIDKILKNSRP
ncbi:dienelactone hydrolase family protein [Membranihabitans maritimus]|uniref:dienelactone hydrolase family protein n=1 Tax=Membranihabitans maritimus TaxID=2904244 RepID=UPI001F1D89E6|nr:alpha/beta fold hydrolase [Membranihabitans maritimus]